MNRRSLALLVLAACERQVAPPEPKREEPKPVKPDPVKQARDEFEVIPQDFAIGTSKLYSHGDFLENSYSEDAFDQGAFVGRLRTLFGAQPGDEYVLRHKGTGFVITAYSGNSGPSLGGGPRYAGKLGAPPDPKDAFERMRTGDDGIAQRIAADPILKAGSPMQRIGKAKTQAESEQGWKDLTVYQRHMDDARAPVGFPAVASELERLISAVPPADWEKTEYDDDSNTVYRVGATKGESFSEDLEPADGLAFLLDRAEKRDPDQRDSLGGIPWRADSHVLYYWEAHRELAQLEPRVRAAWERLARSAKSYDKELRATLADEVRSFGKKLHLSAATITAALK